MSKSSKNKSKSDKDAKAAEPQATPTHLQVPDDVDAREYRLFLSLDLERKGFVHRSDIEDTLRDAGLSPDDARLKESVAALSKHAYGTQIGYEEFCQVIRPNILLIEQALQGNMVIPEFGYFCSEITELYTDTRKNRL